MWYNSDTYDEGEDFRLALNDGGWVPTNKKTEFHKLNGNQGSEAALLDST